MTLNHVKLERAITFMKYLVRGVSLIFIPETLIFWNKITFPGPNSLNIAELLRNKFMKTISKKAHKHSFFYLIYHYLM